jgi:hypothetical protein
MSIGPRRQRQASKRHSSRDIDYGSIIGAVARKLLGEPNARLGKGSELRFGTHGSVCVRRKEKNGEFPPRHRDGQHVSWFTSQIRAYMEKRRQNPSGIGPAPSKANEARRRAKEVGGEPLRASRRVSRASAKRTTDTEITD